MTRDEILAKVRDILVDQLGVEADSVKLEASFQDDLNADSLDLVELIMELEDQFTIKPLTPSKNVPPYSSGSSPARRRRSAGRSSMPPTLLLVPEAAASLMRPKMADEQPSISLSATLPVKPSVTTTSALFWRRSRPSTFPTKFRGESLRSR